VNAVPDRLGTHVAVPEALEKVVMRCLARSPRSRYRSARELTEALVALGMRESWRADMLAPSSAEFGPENLGTGEFTAEVADPASENATAIERRIGR
jgi:hypothetical protein